MNPDDRDDHINDVMRYWFNMFGISGFKGADSLFYPSRVNDVPANQDPELARLLQDVSANRNRPEE